ncbi:unnamed protein product [Phaedon cochleariae]|uniref:Uncharacterized protein n=1 Tax=Phaedon cochleariae TaxID=80249 RepID=A0A9N9SJE8_PHACE|nr:unnamed protein product [Phaedon cochleariae]
MDKENGKGNSKGNSGSNKLSNSQDPDSILDAASLFGAYWPRGDAAANMFAGFGLPAHQSMQFGMLPPGGGGGGSGGAGRQAQGQQQGMPPAYPAATSASAAAAAAAAAAYSNAYNNTLSVAASQAASLGIPAARKAGDEREDHDGRFDVFFLFGPTSISVDSACFVP